MASYDSNTIKAIKKAINLKEFAEEFTKLQPAGEGMWHGRCPHPDHRDSSPSFTVYHRNGNWSWCCYGCHYDKKDTSKGSFGSDAIGFLQWLSHYEGSKHEIKFPEAVMILANKAGIKLKQDKNYLIYQKFKSKALMYHSNLLPFAREYLYSRGLNDADIDKWMLGFGTFPEGFKNSETGRWEMLSVRRIVFPLVDPTGNVVGSSRRKINYLDNKNIAKYKNSKTSDYFHKGKFLYGFNFLNESFKEIRITEGQMDVILSDKYGVKNIVAPMGTAFTEEHAEIIKSKGLQPVFCLDGDEAGQKATKKRVAMLAEKGVHAKVVLLPEGKDMADMANELKYDLEEYIQKNAQPYWRYILQEPLKEYEAMVISAQEKVIPQIIEAMKSISTKEDDILVNSFIKEKFNLRI